MVVMMGKVSQDTCKGEVNPRLGVKLRLVA